MIKVPHGGEEGEKDEKADEDRCQETGTRLSALGVPTPRGLRYGSPSTVGVFVLATIAVEALVVALAVVVVEDESGGECLERWRVRVTV